MISKIYEKVISFIKREYKFLLLCLLIIIIGTLKLPINLYIGGGIINLDKRIQISNEYMEKGSFNLAYVRETRATIPTLLASYIMSWDRESIKEIRIDENDDTDLMWKREKMYLQEANDNAIINAYKLAGEFVDIKNETFKILYLDKNSKTDMQIGDAIISIDGKGIKDYDSIKSIVESKNIGDILTIMVERNKKKIECHAEVYNIDSELKVGIYLIKSFDYKVEKDITLNFSNSEGGSSGGFMLSLAIYNRLIPNDISKGLKIVGTGTIDEYGNVGEIGGIKYKLMGASKEKADVFFVPVDNYDEAIKLKNENNYKMEIVKVSKLIDAVNYLESR